MKTRLIHTKFWLDSYIEDLTPKEKLLFIFLLTNEHVNMVGAYELSLNYTTICTGINKTEIKKILRKFQSDNKMVFVDKFIILMNHLRYQNYSKGSERQKKAYERETSLLPTKVMNIVVNRESLTSSELVSNQLGTSSELDIIHNTKNIIHKTERRKQKEETEIVGKWELELKEIVSYYNELFSRKLESTKGFEENYKYWRDIHDIEKIKKALGNAKTSTFWSDKMTPQMLFRRKSPNGENVDRIEQLCNIAQPKSAIAFC